jgi:hypothetical protein
MDGISQFVINQIGVQGIWFALCLLIGYKYNKQSQDMYNQFKADSLDRETKLETQLQASQEILKQFGEKYDLIIDRLDKLQNVVEGSQNQSGGVAK